MTILRDRVAALRPLYLEPEGTGRTVYAPGELAQWDLWWPDVDIPVGFAQTARLPVIVGTPRYSRWILARMIPSKQTHDVLGGHRWCLEELGAVPRLGVYDGEPAISSRRGKQIVFTVEFQAFRGTFGMGAYVLAPGHPERKGVVERANGYLETSFLPGRSSRRGWRCASGLRASTAGRSCRSRRATAAAERSTSTAGRLKRSERIGRGSSLTGDAGARGGTSWTS